MPNWTEACFGKELQTRTGLALTDEVLREKKLVGIYFSASWCPPCRTFSPILASFYNSVQEVNPQELEIIFVSSDRDEQDFNQHYSTMPYTAIPFSNKDVKQSLAARFSISSIPYLVILDASDGSVVDADGRRTVTANHSKPEAAMAIWG